MRHQERGSGKREVVKLQVEEAVKEGLKDELVTKAEFKEEIAQVKEALKHTATKEEMVKVQLLLKVAIGVMFAGFTIFNPDFRSFVETVIGLLK